MIEKVKISVVTISFNQSSFLEETILSVINQDYENFEYIIIDGASKDGSVDIIKKYSSKLKFWTSEPDDGAAHALNKGFKHASGDFLVYINSDDILLPEAFSKFVNFYNANSNYDVYYGNAVIINEGTKLIGKIFSDKWNTELYALNGISIVQPSTFIRKSLFDLVGGFNTRNRSCWDGELLVDIALAGGRMTRMPSTLSGFRIHSNSITGSGRLSALFLQDCDRINEKIKLKIKVRPFTVLEIRCRKVFRDPYVVVSRALAKIIYAGR
ncbi:glycosyltransferase family 2 protein [Pedobacter sp. SYSU D00535]|uniref:glycosyltransferase family 2 protein n=1 Tax=Pedobacter sp. SYSU D00535 TaxID=2810308 RepID=UPI001A9737AF|nr:glycosyltransferase family 2 protein [Pedobacter sp. SYSU D00535]